MRVPSFFGPHWSSFVDYDGMISAEPAAEAIPDVKVPAPPVLRLDAQKHATRRKQRELHLPDGASTEKAGAHVRRSKSAQCGVAARSFGQRFLRRGAFLDQRQYLIAAPLPLRDAQRRRPGTERAFSRTFVLRRACDDWGGGRRVLDLGWLISPLILME